MDKPLKRRAKSAGTQSLSSFIYDILYNYTYMYKVNILVMMRAKETRKHASKYDVLKFFDLASNHSVRELNSKSN